MKFFIIGDVIGKPGRKIVGEKLKTIKQSPYLLYVRGDLKEERKMLGIVGSRRSTSYGKKILEKIIPELVRAQCGIVSG